MSNLSPPTAPVLGWINTAERRPWVISYALAAGGFFVWLVFIQGLEELSLGAALKVLIAFAAILLLCGIGALCALGAMIVCVCGKISSRHPLMALILNVLVMLGAWGYLHLPRTSDLVAAAGRGDVQQARWCLRLGVDPNRASRRPQLFGQYYIEDETPLTTAVREGHLEVVRLLVEHGADVNRRVPYRQSPLQIAEEGKSERHREIAEYLVKQGANLPARPARAGNP